MSARRNQHQRDKRKLKKLAAKLTPEQIVEVYKKILEQSKNAGNN